jgi:DNA-binding IclR family transcriptional regulator
VSATLVVAEIADRLELPRSTAYRYIAALKSQGLVEDAPGGPGYRLGARILELAATMSRKPLRDVALPYMERISRETGETTILCGLREHVGVCLEKVEGHHALRVSFELGESYPLHAAATGKAILAHLTPDEQKAVLDDIGLPRFTDSTITAVPRLRKDLTKVRKCQYSESVGEAIAGTYGIAAPIFSPSGRILASIGVSVPKQRAGSENRKRLIELIADAATEITKGVDAQQAQSK